MDRMRILGIICVAALSAASLAGCVAERGDCGPLEDNVRIEFGLVGGGQFTASVPDVETGIFDSEGNPIATRHVGREEIERDGGVLLTLAPGRYRLAFWGNRNGNTTVEGHVVRATDGEWADPLFFAPSVRSGDSRTASGGWITEPWYDLTVPRSGSRTHRVEFRPAHRSITFYIAGLGDGMWPTISMEGVPSGLDYFGSAPRGGAVTVSRPTEIVERGGRLYHGAKFRTLRFDAAAEVVVAVGLEGGGEIYSSTLADLLDRAGLADDPAVEAELILTFNITGVVVRPESVTLDPGDSTALEAEVTPAWADNRGVTWTSSDPTVATVDAHGVVRAIAPGTAVITATTEVGGFTDTCTVTVVDTAHNPHPEPDPEPDPEPEPDDPEPDKDVNVTITVPSWQGDDVGVGFTRADAGGGWNCTDVEFYSDGAEWKYMTVEFLSQSAERNYTRL